MSHQILIEPSKHALTTRPNETILEAVLRQGFIFPYGCRNGSCGTCKGKIITGKVHYGQHDKNSLTEADKQAGMALFCSAVPTSDITIECHKISTIKNIEIKTMPCRVERLERIADDIMIISLKLPPNQRLQYLAGQYINILLKDGKRRSFSLANSPVDDEFLQLHVRNYLGGVFANHVFTQMKEKDILRIEGPLGGFCLRDAASQTPVIFIASGTGFAPIKSILEYTFAMESDAHTKREMTLYWGVRTKADLYLLELANNWQQRENFKFIPVLSAALPTDNWSGREGFVHQAVLQDFGNLIKHQVYACGSPVMIKAAHDDLTHLRKLPTDAFFSDIFTPSLNVAKL